MYYCCLPLAKNVKFFVKKRMNPFYPTTPLTRLDELNWLGSSGEKLFKDVIANLF